MGESTEMLKVVIIHGPNLNMLGTREPEIYGSRSLEDIDSVLIDLGKNLDLDVETFQSNFEGEIVEKIQKSLGTCKGLIINPAAYTHTSIAIRDALLLLDAPIIEIHLSNIYRRESFRQVSMIADVASAQIAGFGADGYAMALKALSGMIRSR